MPKTGQILLAPLDGRSYDWWGTGKLNEKGRRGAERARNSLVDRDLGKKLIFLTADMPAALQFTETIADNSAADVIESPRITAAGNNPRSFESLDGMVQTALHESGVEWDGETVVVITPSPAVGYAKGDHNPLTWGASAQTGEIVEYQNGSWNDEAFDAGISRIVETEIMYSSDRLSA
jgi:broad specificity phosphatase PhoE